MSYFMSQNLLKRIWIQTSRLPDFLSEVLRGVIVLRNFIGFIYFILCWIHLHLTRNSFKEHLYNGFYTDFIVFIHWRFIYYGFYKEV